MNEKLEQYKKQYVVVQQRIHSLRDQKETIEKELDALRTSSDQLMGIIRYIETDEKEKLSKKEKEAKELPTEEIPKQKE